MSTLTVTVKEKKVGFEGIVCLPGLKPTKLARQDGVTLFTTTAALKTAARSVGKKLNVEVAYAEPSLKKAAKKNVKSKTTKTVAAKAEPQACPTTTTSTTN